jgi:hypothetical protein
MSAVEGPEQAALTALALHSNRLKFIETSASSAFSLSLSIRQPVNDDTIIEVIHELHGCISFYLDGLHKDAPLAATAFSASHFGPFDNEPPHFAAERLEEVQAVVTKLIQTIKTDETVAPQYRCLTKILAGACLNSHSPMAFDADDIATKLRLIADGHAREYVSYDALRVS